MMKSLMASLWDGYANSMIRVILSHDAEIRAHQIGLARATSIEATPDHPSRKDRDLNFHEFIGQLSESVGAEMAVARYFNLTDFKPTLDTFKTQADVGNAIEVKWTKWVDGHLVIHKSDRLTDIAVLVVGKSPKYALAGWIPVEWAKHKRYFRRQDGNWWIGQENLMPMETFLQSKFADALGS